MLIMEHMKCRLESHFNAKPEQFNEQTKLWLAKLKIIVNTVDQCCIFIKQLTLQSLNNKN